HVFGVQRLAEPALVVRDDVRGRGEDVAGRAVVALEPDHLGAREVVIEAQDVVDLGAAPAVDRLVVVADAADVLWGRWRLRRRRGLVLRDAGASLPLLRMRVWESNLLMRLTLILRSRAERGVSKDEAAGVAARRLRQEPQPQILRDVRVLILVDQNELEPTLILAQHLGVLAEDADGLEQQVTEVRRVEDLQPRLEVAVELHATAPREARGLAGRHLGGREPAVL